MTNDPLLLPTADRQAGAAILTRAQDPDDPGMTVIGRSGRRLTTQLQPGDIILSGQGSRLAIVSDPRLLQRQAAAAEGLLTEGPWPGQYARVCGADGQPSPFARRVVGSDGLVLPEVWVLRPVELDEAAFDEAFEGRLAVLEDEQALDLERPLRQRTPAGGPPPAAPAATIEVVIDHDNDHVVDAASPVATAVMFGLWDRAFDAAGDLRNGAAEADNFVGSDARRFYLRVRDTSASGSTVVAR